MRCLAVLTVVVAFLALAHASHPDQIVQSKNFPWGLSSSNQWKLFPELGISLDLYADSFVDISYTVSGALTSTTHFLTKVMINGKEDKRFRQISGNSVYFTASKTLRVFLRSGTHDIEVYYRTPGTVHNLHNADYGIAYLQVTRC